MMPLTSWPRTSCPTSRYFACYGLIRVNSARFELLGLDVRDADLAALRQLDHVEVEDGFAGGVVANVPEALVGLRHQRRLHLRHVVDSAGAFHRIDERVDVVVAGGRALRRLVVGEGR